MSEWEGLDDPATTTGLMRQQEAVLPVHIPVPETGPHPPVNPLNQTPHAIPHAAPGQVQQLPQPSAAPELDEKIARAITRAFTMEKDQLRALRAAKEVDDENVDTGRKKIISWIIGGLLGVGGIGGGGGWYITREGPESDLTPTEAVRRHSVDARLGNVEIKQRLIQGDINDVEKDLDTHVEVQQKENEADKLRSLRQEMMLEQLIRLRGRTPPKKAESLRDAERAVGIDPDDPFDDQ